LSVEIICDSLEGCKRAHEMIYACGALDLACGGTTNNLQPSFPHEGGYRCLTVHAAFFDLVVELNVVWRPYHTVRAQSWEVSALLHLMDNYCNLDEFGKRGEITLQDAMNFSEGLPFVSKKLRLKFIQS